MIIGLLDNKTEHCGLTGYMLQGGHVGYVAEGMVLLRVLRCTTVYVIQDAH
jgi:hypothetical protein